MNRLTEKTNDTGSYNIDTDFNPKRAEGYDLVYGSGDLECAIGKLGRLEDLEDELGIDLITLFKALKNGVWYKKDDYETPLFEGGQNLYLSDICIAIQDYNVCEIIGSYREYGKTWALTKEELL